MPTKSFILAVLIGLATIAACGDSPSRPSGPPGPTPPQSPVVSNVRVEAPSSIPPGASVQFSLIATFSDGTSIDAASQATWATTNASVLSFSPGGLANGRARGEARVAASFLGRSSSQVTVFVLEDGTFRVSGRVTESSDGLPDARIEVVAGTGAGLTATSGSGGSYALYGVAGEAVIEVTLDGFEKERRTVVVNGALTLNVELRPAVEPTDLRGDWRLTLSASGGCAPGVPQDVAARSYGVTIQQTGTQLQVQVKSPPTVTAASWLAISGRVVDRTVTITLPVDDFYYPFYGIKFFSIIEMLGAGRFLAFSGTARGDRAGNAVTGGFNGELAVYRNENNGAVWNQDFSCNRADHGFRLDRD
jgi:hypothetical protein